jgi:ribulose-bisphosphate carboxylase small chain
MAFHLTQGTFSYLPALTDDEILAQIQYALDQGWAINIEFTDDAHPRNVLWEMWELPMFDMRDPVAVMGEIQRCRAAYPHHYVKVNAYDTTPHRQTTALSFIVQRPLDDPGFHLDRAEGHDRVIRYTLRSYASERPTGMRYAPSDHPGAGRSVDQREAGAVDEKPAR